MSSPAGLATVDIPDLSPAVETCVARILDAFADLSRESGFLAVAAEAERTTPGNPIILCLAATAALFDGEPQRAQIYLKRYTKRAHPGPAHHLLSALALAAQGKRDAARLLLERRGLDKLWSAAEHFPGGMRRLHWLHDRYREIFSHKSNLRAVQTRPKTSRSTAPARAAPPKQTVTRPSGAVPMNPIPAIPRLPRIEVDIPVDFDINVGPLRAPVLSPAGEDERWFGLRERFAHLGLAQGFDELLCHSHLNQIEIFWYQTETVRKVLKQFRGRVLLADEVGLGKTVEAGMVLKEYILRGMVQRALVLVPASLVGQWREELQSKFGIGCATTQDELLRRDPDRFWAQPFVIASLALARRAEHMRRLEAHAYDLVIVDEAHHLRDCASQSYRLVDGLNKRFLLLLSATPVQNSMVELYNLLTLLKPGIFKTQKEFRAAHMVAGNARQPSSPDRLRELMRTVMIRNTRAVVALKLPRRHATTLRVDAGDAEQAAYRELANAVRGIAAERGGKRLALGHLLGAAGSSPRAAETALLRFAERHDGTPRWQALALQWRGIDICGKETLLVDLLRRNPEEKKLVFVHYRATLDRLSEILAAHGIAFARFDGSLSGPEKDAAIAEFREGVHVLLCTESGGEGRNIQFCNTLINFDIPWNPMAIEQRIGRLDRIGQTREVFVFNLTTRGTIEDEILKLLDEKIAMFELIVGEAGAILGSIEDEEGEFSSLILDAWLESTEAARTEAIEGLGTRLIEARTRHEGAKVLDEALFGDEFEAA